MIETAPIDPKKIRGKYVPDPASTTDITADPIDNPPEKTAGYRLPKSDAKIEQEQKDPRPIDNPESLIISIFLTIAAATIPALLNMLIHERFMEPLNLILVLALSLAALVHNLKNSHTHAKTFPILGFNPVHTLAIIQIIIILASAYALLSWILNGPFKPS